MLEYNHLVGLFSQVPKRKQRRAARARWAALALCLVLTSWSRPGLLAEAEVAPLENSAAPTPEPEKTPPALPDGAPTPIVSPAGAGAPRGAPSLPPTTILQSRLEESARGTLPEGPPAEDLSSILKSVLSRNGQIAESEQDIEIARQQLERVRAAAWPKGEVIALGAPIFEARGNALVSTSNWNKWGPFLQGGGQLIQPLFTFGQLAGYKSAAENQIEARTHLAQVKRLEVLYSAKDFYYSYLMAHDLEKLVDDLVGVLGEAVKAAEESQKGSGKTAVKPHDIYRLKTALDDLEQKKLLARQGRMTAERAVIWISGNKFSSVTARTLKIENFEKQPLEQYLTWSKNYRPEFRALSAGQVARDSLAKAKQAQSYPTVFIGGMLSAAWSPVRDKQQSWFALDQYNRVQGGAGLGVRIDLEFLRHSAEAAEERAEAMKLRATELYAVPGIDLQVKRAFWEVEQALEGYEIAKRRRDVAKKWYVSNAMGWSIGVTPAKDLLESLEGNGLARRNYVETVYQYNLALAKLSQAVGKEVTDLKYRREE